MPQQRRKGSRRLFRYCIFAIVILFLLLHLPLVARLAYLARGHWNEHTQTLPPTPQPTPPRTPPPQTETPTSAQAADAAAARALKRVPHNPPVSTSRPGAAATWELREASAEPGTQAPVQERVDVLRLGTAIHPPALRYGDGIGHPDVSVLIAMSDTAGNYAIPEVGRGWFGTLQGAYNAEGPEWATQFEVLLLAPPGSVAPGWVKKWPLLRVVRVPETDRVSLQTTGVVGLWKAGLREARGSLVVFLNVDARPSGPRFLETLLGRHRGASKHSKGPVVVGCRVVNPPGSSHPPPTEHCGPRCMVDSFGAAAAESMNSDNVLYRRWAGVSPFDSRVNKDETINATSPDRVFPTPQCLLLERDLAVAVAAIVTEPDPNIHGMPLPESGPWAFATGAALIAFEQAGAVVVSAEAEVMNFKEPESDRLGPPALHTNHFPPGAWKRWGG
eukprot:Hpha_TRINITY_DN19792_c0_g1::TRINITY_DN19792_c0_g1_i1::g.21696::m.21696